MDRRTEKIPVVLARNRPRRPHAPGVQPRLSHSPTSEARPKASPICFPMQKIAPRHPIHETVGPRPSSRKNPVRRQQTCGSTRPPPTPTVTSSTSKGPTDVPRRKPFYSDGPGFIHSHPKNKSRKSGVFFASKITPSTHHDFTTHPPRFPPSKNHVLHTVFPQNPHQKNTTSATPEKLTPPKNPPPNPSTIGRMTNCPTPGRHRNDHRPPCSPANPKSSSAASNAPASARPARRLLQARHRPPPTHRHRHRPGHSSHTHDRRHRNSNIDRLKAELFALQTASTRSTSFGLDGSSSSSTTTSPHLANGNSVHLGKARSSLAGLDTTTFANRGPSAQSPNLMALGRRGPQKLSRRLHGSAAHPPFTRKRLGPKAQELVVRPAQQACTKARCRTHFEPLHRRTPTPSNSTCSPAWTNLSCPDGPHLRVARAFARLFFKPYLGPEARLHRSSPLVGIIISSDQRGGPTENYSRQYKVHTPRSARSNAQWARPAGQGFCRSSVLGKPSPSQSFAQRQRARPSAHNTYAPPGYSCT